MLCDRDIVCFSSDWSGDPTSKTHIMRRLARTNRVLWVDSIGYRTPRASARDLRRALSKARDIARGRRRVADNLWRLSPPAVPFYAQPFARRLNRSLLRAALGHAIRRLGFRDYIGWAFLPSASVVAGQLGEKLLVYHCVDEFSEFSGVDGSALRAMEADLAARADLVVVSAERLLESKRRINPNTFLVRHGVEVEHFGRALDADTVVPGDLGKHGGPVIGFFGLVADWVDLELVRFLARARPHWRFVLIGRTDTDVGRVEGEDNVRLLGWRSYSDLPRYCKGFDVAILPFKVNELTLAANPLKLREYLAAGLSVVSTAIPEAERLRPLVRVARDGTEFLAQLDELLASAPWGPQRETARSVASESWDSKAEEIGDIVSRFLAPHRIERGGERERRREPAQAPERGRGATVVPAQGAP
jgi:hypothetical protein